MFCYVTMVGKPSILAPSNTVVHCPPTHTLHPDIFDLTWTHIIVDFSHCSLRCVARPKEPEVSHTITMETTTQTRTVRAVGFRFGREGHKRRRALSTARSCIYPHMALNAEASIVPSPLLLLCSLLLSSSPERVLGTEITQCDRRWRYHSGFRRPAKAGDNRTTDSTGHR